VNGALLRWDLVDVPFGGLRIAYRVQPQRLGLHDTNVQASANFVDGLEVAGRLRFPVPQVNVLAEDPTVTPTVTPYPTATPVPRPGKLFLPLVLRQRCAQGAVHADVALVMDTSGSMNEPNPGGGTKLSVAKDAARSFILQLSPLDRGALVAFNTQAAIAQTLTGDKQALLVALASLSTSPGTRIDRGLDVGRSVLTAEPPAMDRNRVMIVLTDGRSDDVGNEVVLAAADQAKGSNIEIFTIGLGADVDPLLLQLVATRGDHYFPAPTASELTAIYEAIAYALPCAGLDWP
jgi:Mg-chelatase subunit ChlD